MGENLWLTKSESKKIEKIRKQIEIEYIKAFAKPWIDKPFAYAVYQVWKRIDAEEKGRHGKEEHDAE